MVSKVIQEYGNNGFCFHINHKKVGMKKKGFTCRKTGFVFPFYKKKVLCYKKTGIAKAKKCKNRIYLRKKGDDKNRKKKDFFPPSNVELFP